MLRISDCIRDAIRLAIPQPTEWQHVRNEIDAAMIFAGPDFVNVLRVDHLTRFNRAVWLGLRRRVPRRPHLIDNSPI